MKKFSLFLILIVLVVLSVSDAAMAQYKKPRPKEGSDVKVDDEKYKPAGVLIGQTVIKFGDELTGVWSLLGPPDRIWAMRAKEDKEKDYVKMDYFSYGMSVDISNNGNKVQGILIEENNTSCKLVNCPFRIGQDQSYVTNAWGAPEKNVSGTMAYWKRGVYIGIKDGKISYIFITSPGEFREEKKAHGA